MWCDASDLAIGVVLEIDGRTAEDAAWLRKKHDHSHINLAEIDAAVRGLALAIRWKLKFITLMMDSVAVKKWLNTAIEDERPLRSRALAEMLIKRRIGVFKETMEAYDATVDIQLVPSHVNKADVLTRVPRH